SGAPRRNLLTLERQPREPTPAGEGFGVDFEGEAGGPGSLIVKKGKMPDTAEPALPPLMTVYQPRPYFDWAASMATDAGLFGPGTRNNQGELTRSRIERLKLLQGLIQFTFTHLPDGGEQSFCIQLGEGERPTAAQTVLSMKAEDAQKMARGEINPQVAFMGGIIKVTPAMPLPIQFAPPIIQSQG